MKVNIEEILDRCIDGVREGKSVQEVLQAYPDQADELRPLLQLVGPLESLPEPEPTVHGLLRGIVLRSATQRTKPRRKLQLLAFPSVVLTRLAASTALILVLGWGTAAVSSDSVPGDFLYPAKLLTEKVRFILTLNTENQAELRIVFSEERMAEALKKYTRGEGLDEGLLTTMLEEARLAIENAGDLPAPDRKRIVARAAAASVYQKQILADMKEGASQVHRQQIDRWMNRCQRRWQWMCGVEEQATPAQENGEPNPQRWRSNCMQNCPVW